MEAVANIIMIQDSSGTPIKLITEYRRITVEKLKQTCKTSLDRKHTKHRTQFNSYIASPTP